MLGLAVLVPTVVTTAPLAWTRTENGQLAALHTLCARIPAHSAVLFMDAELAYRWVPAVRDECGVPTATSQLVRTSTWHPCGRSYGHMVDHSCWWARRRPSWPATTRSTRSG